MTGRFALVHPARTVAVPLALVAGVFLAVSLPRYAGLDPSRSLSRIPASPSWYYAVLVVHIGFGTVAMVAACLQVWPWLRRRHPVVHRGAGRVYVFGAVLPASLAVLSIAPFNPSGPIVTVGSMVLGLLWLVTALAGWRAARGRRFAAHREWMVRGVALTFSIVADRLWLPVCFAVFTPGLFAGDAVDPATMKQAVGVALWLSIVVNLSVAEAWLHHTRHRRPATRPRSAQAAPST